MENIEAFRECYDRWASWIGLIQDNIPRNTIWYQCTEMMNNEFMFQALFLAGNKATSQANFHDYLAANTPLYKHLLEGYLSFQYLAIRRLTEKITLNHERQFRGVISIVRLLDDMEKHTAVITREAFVCVKDLPYNYREVLELEKAEAMAKMQHQVEGRIWLEKPSIGAESLQRHITFDRLSGTTEDKRQPTDIIMLDYWQQYRRALKESGLDQVKKYVDKYLAHAADEPSLTKLDDEDKKQSMHHIHKTQRCLITQLQRLTTDFYGTQLAMLPTDGEAQLLYNFDKPFVSKEVVTKTREELYQKIKDYLSLI